MTEQMTEERFKARTKRFALAVIEVVAELPRGTATEILGRQALRSATSVGANYRAACRAKSLADMAAKLAIVEEEADETLYWLDLLVESNLVSEARVAPIINEANQILAMTVASIRTLRRRSAAAPNPKSKL